MNGGDMGGDRAWGYGRSAMGQGTGSDANRVLVVAASPIIRIVICRTVERIYLRPTPAAPEGALRALEECRPAMVIIDGAANTGAIQPFLQDLMRRRSISQARLPRVLLIAESDRREPLGFAGLNDAIVPKPITPDVLQPAVEKLMRGQGMSS